MIISICVPTYNRCEKLRSLLDNPLKEAKDFKEQIEFCISDNCSSDKTPDLVKDYMKKYPKNIRYKRLDRNLGFDINLLSAISMSTGNFIWLMGDDDCIKEGGIKEILNLLGDMANKDVAIVMPRSEIYFKNEDEKKEFFDSSYEEIKEKVKHIPSKNIIENKVKNNSFLSILIINGKMLKDVIDNDEKIIDQCKDSDYIHVLLIKLILMKFHGSKAYDFNEVIVSSEVPRYYWTIEDEFRLVFNSGKVDFTLRKSEYYNSNKFLLSSKIFPFSLTKNICKKFFMMRSFDVYNFDSLLGCIALFFKKAGGLQGFLISLNFIIFLFIPSFLLRFVYKNLFLRMFYGVDKDKQWTTMVKIYNSKGSRRRAN